MSMEEYKALLGDQRHNPVGLKIVFEHVKNGVIDQKKFLEIMRYIRHG